MYTCMYTCMCMLSSQGRTFDAFEPQSECDASATDLATATQFSTMLRVLRVVKLLRLLRLARLFRLLERWREAIGLSHNLQASYVYSHSKCGRSKCGSSECSHSKCGHSSYSHRPVAQHAVADEAPLPSHGMCTCMRMACAWHVQRLTKLLFLMLLFSHWDGCLLFLLAYLEVSE